MRTIVHLSDLHFGNVHLLTLKPLHDTVHLIKPDPRGRFGRSHTTCAVGANDAYLVAPQRRKRLGSG
jgi:hypothetical protein